MIKKKTFLLLSTILFVFGLLITANGSKVYADTCDGSGDCDIAGEYQINGLRALKVQTTISNGLPRDIFIGDGAGNNNPDSSGRAFGDIFIGRHAGYSLVKMTDTNNIGASTIIGDLAAEYLTSSVHNTIIGAQANGLACSAAVPCNANPLPQYNTVVGTMAGLMNHGDYNKYFGTEAGKFITTGDHNILIGVNAGAAYGGGGPTNLTTGDGNIHIGGYTEAANGDISYSLAIGLGAKAEDDNQIVFGSDYFYKESYWGSGVISSDPQDFSFNASGGSGTNVAGANMTIAGGKSTGSADGGSIIFQTSPAGSSGSSQNALKDRMTIDSDGNVIVGNGIDSVTPYLRFDALYDNCGMSYNSGSDWLYMNCSIWPEAVYLRGAQVWVDSPAAGTYRANAITQLNLQSPVIYLTGSTGIAGGTDDNNIKVGIGTSSPSEALHVNGNVRASGYKSSDGSAGLTQSINLKGSDGNNCSLTVKNGLITATTCP